MSQTVLKLFDSNSGVWSKLTNAEVDVALSSTDDKLRSSDIAAARRSDQTT